MVINFWKSVTLFVVFVVIAAVRIEASPRNLIQSSQNLDAVETEIDDVQNSYFDLPEQQQPYQNVYPSIPVERWQMLLGRYNSPRPLPSASDFAMNELYRLPEAKRQVRYRQCFFNPITCFRK